MELICFNTVDPPYFAFVTCQHLNSTCASTQLQIFFHTGTIFDVVIAMAIISILYLYYCCTIYKLLFGIKGTQISHAFHDFCWLHLNFPIIMEHEPFTSSLPLFGNLGNECHFSLPKLPKNRRRI